MRRKGIGISILGYVVLFTALAQAQVTIPDPVPPISLEVSPASPTFNDTIDLQLSGSWPDTCTPQGAEVVVDGDSIVVRMLLPGALDCIEPICQPIASGYGVSAGVGPLPPGTYQVYAQPVSCSADGPTEFVGSFTVTGLPAGAPPRAFAPGTTVVLLESDAPGLPGLQAGRTGTVICCASEDCAGEVLISWHFYAAGLHDTRSCADDQPTIYRPGSASLVNPDLVRFTALPAGFNETGLISERAGCIVFQGDNGRLYNLANGPWLQTALTTGPILFGDHVRVRGLHVLGGPRPPELAACPEEDGDIYEPIITLVAPAGGPGNGNGNGNGNGDGECPNDTLTLDFQSGAIRLTKDPDCPDTPRTFSGCTTVGFSSDLNATLSVTVIPGPGVGGTWTATVRPDLIAAGEEAVLEICVSAEGLDLSTIPSGESVVASFTLVSTTQE